MQGAWLRNLVPCGGGVLGGNVQAVQVCLQRSSCDGLNLLKNFISSRGVPQCGEQSVLRLKASASSVLLSLPL